MEIKHAIKYLDQQIEVLEKQLFYFDMVLKPRAEKDKEILSGLKLQAVRIDALSQKMERGEQITDEEIRDAVPQMFR